MRSTLPGILALTLFAVSARGVESGKDGPVINPTQAARDAGALADPVAPEREALEQRMEGLGKANAKLTQV